LTFGNRRAELWGRTMNYTYPVAGNAPGIPDLTCAAGRGDRPAVADPVATRTLPRQHRPPAPSAARTIASQAPVYTRWGKRALDVVLVIAGLPVILPVIAICVVLLSIQGGNPFYLQRRLGLNGKPFSMLKLRTMVPDAEHLLDRHLASDPALRREWDRTQKLKHDPRITPIGRFLRRTSLDELPQLWHVLTGEMSLVGPRPMLPQQAEIYGDMRAYTAFRPGLTGQWQVMERNESDFTCRAEADRTYAQNCSLWTDVNLIVRTFGVVLDGTGY